MADDNNINPWQGQDDQSWQPSHIEEGKTVASESADSNDSDSHNDWHQSGQDADAKGETTRIEPTQPVLPVTEPQPTAPVEGQPLPSGAPAASGPGQQVPAYRPAPLYGAYAPAGQQAQPQQNQGQPQPETGQDSGQADQAQNKGFIFGQRPPAGQPQQPNGYGAPNAPNPSGPYPPVGGQPGQFQPGGARPLAPQPTPGQPRYVLTAVIAAVVAAALMLALGWAAITNGWVSVPNASSLGAVSSDTSGQGSAKVPDGKAPDWQAVAKTVSTSVVSIQVQVNDSVGAGSGAILDEQGHIVTNNHVVSGAQKIQVTLANGQIYSAQVVGTDSTADLAVIKLDNPPKDLKPAEFADSSKLAVGENVMAIGNPLGYDNTATTGIVSALDRPVSVMDESGGTPVVTNAIQLDAAINPGNSGGPTFNVAGQVVGINSSIASTATSKSQAGSIGIGFAIPSNLAKRISNEIIKDGKVKHVALGITIQSGTAQADGVTRGGAKVMKVTSGSPADKAGIKEGDVIVAFNDHAVNNNYSLLGYVRAAEFGSQAKITVVRSGRTMDVNATLNQEEQAVNGTPKSDSNGRSKKKHDDSNGGSDSDGSNGSDGGSGDDDPFSFLFGGQ
ncbi:peptidase S1 and S6, chymotrypsin/Hap [Bifidobacterium actinocoloniiforme DSM 22766]|uniref:Peptidase S1 and S6, chymotrypsin/Hap n=1 Tax=Bifidobacterium actinocoloniiforme DSM 22766 TaxID=1437605 RepID=A0A086YWF6_9BIFI|nr:trypsin-like peptidase domain-containing protein [Bifidobacterium actinocoloniiforme]AKV55803.1 peptidase [Bifidobacterium actinocoloniiforme DSM 22766]KFI38606.1 peptidase S1 and S6, chymotrypsin/Hap [Bifidobacterium actinocoloniiforme DSM 22766]